MTTHRNPHTEHHDIGHLEADGLDARSASPALADDRGMATTEYALVTVAAAGFAGVLVVLLKSEQVRELLLGIVTSALG